MSCNQCYRTYCASDGKPVLCDMIKQPITIPVVVRPWPTWQLNTMAGKGADELLSNSWGMSLMALMNWSKSCSSGALVAVIGILEYLRINTMMIILNCICSRRSPYGLSNIPPQRRRGRIAWQTQSRSALRWSIIFLGGWGRGWGIFVRMNCFPTHRMCMKFDRQQLVQEYYRSWRVESSIFYPARLPLHDG